VAQVTFASASCVSLTAHIRPKRGTDVKKLLLAVLATAGGALAFKKIKAGKEEQDLWAEATDPVR
jgi:hypothetical protein